MTRPSTPRTTTPGPTLVLTVLCAATLLLAGCEKPRTLPAPKAEIGSAFEGQARQVHAQLSLARLQQRVLPDQGWSQQDQARTQQMQLNMQIAQGHLQHIAQVRYPDIPASRALSVVRP